MYVIEYLVYHLRAFGVDTPLAGGAQERRVQLQLAYASAIRNMGADDAFRKELTADSGGDAVGALFNESEAVLISAMTNR